MVAGLDVGNTFANRFHDTGTLVTQDDGKGALGILAGERVCVGVADASVVDFDPDLMGLGRGDLDILDAELLAGFPGDSCLACDGLGRGECV